MASAARPAPARAVAADPASRLAAGHDEAALPVEGRWLLILGIMAATVLQILDTTIANVAIPHMQAALGATSDTVTWVLTSYIVASAIAMPVTGWLADRIGSRRLFLLAVVGFVVASMLCGAAQNLTEMVLFRMLQGAAAAFINPLSQSSMLDVTRPSQQARAMSIWGMGIMVGPIMGPLIGGWLTENYNWRWCFYVNVPVGIATIAILWAKLPSRPIARRRFDTLGFALLGIAIGSLQLMLDRGQTVDWFSSVETWIYAGLLISCGWMFGVHLVTADNPMFSRRLLSDRNFIVALGFMLVIGVLMLATMSLLPPMLQHLFNYSVLDSGKLLMPRGFGILISMAVAGQLSRRGLDTRILVGTGIAIAGVSLWEMSGWSLQLDAWHVIVSGVVQGLGLGLVFIPLNMMAFATLPGPMRTEGASLLNLVRSIGASVGISIVTTFLARNIQTSHSALAGHVTAYSMDAIDPALSAAFGSVGQGAMALLDAEVNRQAAMIAYIDDFWLMMWISFAAVPLVLFMRRGKADPAAAAHAMAE